MLTLTKDQTTGNYILEFTNKEARQEFIGDYRLEKADELLKSQEWEDADWQTQQDKFQEALTGTGYSYREQKHGDIWLIHDAMEYYFCNGFLDWTDENNVAFDDGNCDNVYADGDDEESGDNERHGIITLNEYYSEGISWQYNLIEYLLTRGKIIFTLTKN